MGIERQDIFGCTHVDTGTHNWDWSISPADTPQLSDKPLRTQESDRYSTLHSAALNFLDEYEAYKSDPDGVIFVPSKEVLEAFRKAVKG